MGKPDEIKYVITTPYTVHIDGWVNVTMGTVPLGKHYWLVRVNMMGGEISVESTIGVGTTFTVRLPAIPSRYTNTDMVAKQARLQ